MYYKILGTEKILRCLATFFINSITKQYFENCVAVVVNCTNEFIGSVFENFIHLRLYIISCTNSLAVTSYLLLKLHWGYSGVRSTVGVNVSSSLILTAIESRSVVLSALTAAEILTLTYGFVHESQHLFKFCFTLVLVQRNFLCAGNWSGYQVRVCSKAAQLYQGKKAFPEGGTTRRYPRR